MENELPEGWVETTLENIADWGSGGTPNRSEKKYYDGNIPWVKTGDLNDGILTEASEYITELGLKNSSAKLFPKGSIAIAMYGATIGKLSILGIDATTNQACGVAQVRQGIDNKFLFYYLKSQKENFIEQGKGGAQPNISQTVLKLYPFPLPPLAEQTRIVAKLDAAFGHLETLKTSLARIPELLKKFRQTVLTQAVTGKLTEDRNSEGYYEEINKAFLLDKRLVRSTEDEIDFAKSIYKNHSIKSWRFYPLESLVDLKRGIPYGIVQTGDHTEDGIPTIRCGDIKQFAINRNLKKVSPQIEKEYLRTRLRGGEVILAIRGTVGHVAVVPDDFKEYNISREVALIPVIESVEPKFIAILLQSPEGFRTLDDKVKGIAQRGINLADVKRFVVNLPSLEEQKEIVNRVEALFAQADALEAQYQSLRAKIDKLPQALLAKAFRGELVPQDPADEPASVLLEKIKAATAAVGKKGRKSGQTALAFMEE